MKVSTQSIPIEEVGEHEDVQELLSTSLRRVPLSLREIVVSQHNVFPPYGRIYEGEKAFVCEKMRVCNMFLWVPKAKEVIAWLATGARIEWVREDWSEETVMSFLRDIVDGRCVAHVLPWGRK